VLPPGEGIALLIRIADGHLVRKTEIAASANNISLLGRRLLYQDTESPSTAIAVRDLLTDHVLWRVEVGDDFQVIEVEGADELAVFSKRGDFILIDMLEGGISMQTRLKVSTQSGRPHILAKKDVRILAIPASSKNPPRYDPRRVPLTIRGHIPFSGKLVALESKHGALLWQKKVQHVGLALPQPSGVPILVLATNITSPVTPGQPTSSSSCEFRLIDTQTGQDAASIRPFQGRATQLILKSSITEKSRDFVLSTNWGSIRLIYPLNFD